MNNGDTPKILDDLFHEFLNAVNNIDFETQTFPLLVKMDGLENALKYENRSVKEKIALMLNTAKSEHGRSCNLLKSIETALDKAGVNNYKPFTQDLAQVLEKLKRKLDSAGVMYINIHNDEEAEAILKEFLTLAPSFLSIKKIYDRFKDNLISKGVYHAK